MIVVMAPHKLHSMLMLYFKKRVFYIEMPEIDTVLHNLRNHTDMGVHMTPKGVVIAPDIFDAMQEKLLSIGFDKSQICEGETKLAPKYPADIAYNCLSIENQFFHHAKTDPKIISIYESCGFKMHLVKQGYVKCSTLVVGKSAVITEDFNLHKAFVEAHIESLLIPKGEILLKGFDYGFIGGSGGLHNSRLFLNGSLKHHTNQLEIEQFIKAQGTEVVELHQGQLEDCGSIFIFEF